MNKKKEGYYPSIDNVDPLKKSFGRKPLKDTNRSNTTLPYITYRCVGKGSPVMVTKAKSGDM